MTLIRVGLVGAGFASRFHFQGYSRVYGVSVKVIGITDIHPEAREEFARNHGVQSFSTLEELCDAVDVVDLCTPARTHEPLAVTSLERGKHVVIEKPFTGYYGPATGDFRGDTFSK